MTSERVASLVRAAFLDDADPEAVSHAVRDVLERRGALVSEHRHSRIRFHGLRPKGLSWMRAGYVGIYQPLGEREVEVRLWLRARWPWRILWTVCITNLALLFIALAANAGGTTWSVFAILGGLALIVAGLTYVATIKGVRAEERAIIDDFEKQFEALPDVEVMTDEERELAALEAELEGEITRKTIEASRPPPEKGGRFRLRPGKKARDAAPAPEGETPEEKRARLLARKAELEAKRAEDAREPEREQ